MLDKIKWAFGGNNNLKCIIAGSRNIIDPNLLYPTLDLYYPYINEVICGCARGVDSIGLQWALDRYINIVYFPADWNRYHNAAGYIRNTQMGEYADFLLAFWDGESKGTMHMINIMCRLNKPYFAYIIS